LVHAGGCSDLTTNSPRVEGRKRTNSIQRKVLFKIVCAVHTVSILCINLRAENTVNGHSPPWSPPTTAAAADRAVPRRAVYISSRCTWP